KETAPTRAPMPDPGPAAAAAATACAAGARRPVPAVLWLLWFDGWTQATELHHRCLESWQLFNPGWDVRAISRADIPGLLGDLLPEYERLRVAMNPLEKWGGFWIPPAAEERPPSAAAAGPLRGRVGGFDDALPAPPGRVAAGRGGVGLLRVLPGEPRRGASCHELFLGVHCCGSPVAA
ncbi:unnamed protein product, partial [Prorocentrum cordatum]